MDRLLDRMERDVTDPRVSTSELLRLCVLLGGQAGSAALRDWARLELDGYMGVGTEIPRYRRVMGILMLDGATTVSLISQQPIDPVQLGLPEEMEDVLRGPVDLAQPLAELERLAREGVVKITPPAMTAIVALVNHKSTQPGQVITSLYWVINPATIAAVVDRVRTQLAALIAELRSLTPLEQAIPSATSADQAIQVVIHGDQRGPISIQHSNTNVPALPTRTKWQRLVAFLRESWGWLASIFHLAGLGGCDGLRIAVGV